MRNMICRILLMFAYLSFVANGVHAMTEKEMFAIINQVNARVARGDAESITTLKTLPKDYAASALLNIFEQNYHLYLEKPENRRIALKVGEVLTEIPGSEG